MKSYDTYIFDLDGTITNTMTVWLGILHDALLHFEITPPDDKILAWYSHDWKELRHIGFPEEKFDEFGAFIYELANKRLPEAAFQSNAYETLELLKEEGKQIAIFSSMDREMFAPVMQQRNLYAITTVAIAGTDVPYRKPNPAGVLKALEALGVSAASYDRAVYVGDKDTDIQTAQNAGIDSILYFPKAHSAIYDLEDLKKQHPTAIMNNWVELQEV